MYVQVSLVEKHFRETEELLRKVHKDDIAAWLLTTGYFPESSILAPTFVSKHLALKREPYNKDVKDLTRRQLSAISYPKSLLSSRTFAIQHPWNYHDIVFYLHQNWDAVLDKLFAKELRFFSYSLPIPVTKKKSQALGALRAGRMIYEWVKMAEKDLVLDAAYFKLLARTDITNFYSSIYTHSIAWALEGREAAFADKSFSRPGNKIDRLVQYANDARTNGIPVGSALSDLIAELVLSDVDARVSNKLAKLDFVAVRFKDDYRILCKNEEDAKLVLSTLSAELNEFNLVLNERKTSISTLPDGLYRTHDREYFPHSLRERVSVSFKRFEHTLLIGLDIHRKYPGTSILEKFLSELLTQRNTLKLRFSDSRIQKLNEAKKFFSLLFLLKRESEKLLSNVLALIELVYLEQLEFRDDLKPYLRSIVEAEIKLASDKGSAFEVVWLVFFSRYIGLGIVNFSELVSDSELRANPFVKCILSSQDKLYADTGIQLFRKPSDCKGRRLVDQFDVFQREAQTQQYDAAQLEKE